MRLSWVGHNDAGQERRAECKARLIGPHFQNRDTSTLPLTTVVLLRQSGGDEDRGAQRADNVRRSHRWDQ
jgi:hypothetical protein